MTFTADNPQQPANKRREFHVALKQILQDDEENGQFIPNKAWSRLWKEHGGLSTQRSIENYTEEGVEEGLWERVVPKGRKLRIGVRVL